MRSTVSESWEGISRLAKNASIRGEEVKMPWMEALSSPARMSSVDARAPNNKDKESMTRLFPAPVSPVKTVNPSWNEHRRWREWQGYESLIVLALLPL